MKEEFEFDYEIILNYHFSKIMDYNNLSQKEKYYHNKKTLDDLNGLLTDTPYADYLSYLQVSFLKFDMEEVREICVVVNGKYSMVGIENLSSFLFKTELVRRYAIKSIIDD